MVLIIAWWLRAIPLSTPSPTVPRPRPNALPLTGLISRRPLWGTWGREAGAIVIEPDDYAAGTILTNVASGVTLTAQGASSEIRSQTASYHSTGTRVFAYGTDTEWYSNSIWLRADFGSPATSVSIDLVPNDSSDPGIMRAYNATGTLLSQVICAAPPSGSFATMTITRPSADIAYVLAAGQEGDTALLDHLVVTGIGDGSDYYKVAAGAGNPLGDHNDHSRGRTPSIRERARSEDRTLRPERSAGRFGRQRRRRRAECEAGLCRHHGGRLRCPRAVRQRQCGRIRSLDQCFAVDGRAVPTDVTEMDGTMMGTIGITLPLANDLDVRLASADPARIAVPAVVTIPAGQTSVTLPITMIDDAFVAGGLSR